MNPTTEDINTYMVILISNSLSILSSLCIITVYALAKSLRVYAFKIVFYLSLIDLLKSFSMIIPTFNLNSSSFLCNLQAVSYQYFTILSFLLAFQMSLSLYFCIFSSSDTIIKQKFPRRFFILGLASALTFPQFAFHSYGKANSWCWIKEDFYLFRILSFYLPLWIINLVNILIYFKIVQNFREKRSPLGRLVCYPFILILCYLPGTICRVLEIFGSVPDFFIYATVIGDGLCGLINSLCYGWTDHVKSYVHETICYKRKAVKDELLDINSFTI